MDTASDDKKWARLCVMFLLILSSSLLVLHSAQLASETTFYSLFVFTTLLGSYTLLLCEWRNHGFIFGLVAVFVFVLTVQQAPNSSQEMSRIVVNQLLFLSVLGIHLIVCPQLNTKTCSPSFWVVATVSMLIVSTLVCMEGPSAGCPIANAAVQDNDHYRVLLKRAAIMERLRICSFCLVFLGGVFGVLTAIQREPQAWLWLGSCLLAVLVGFGVIGAAKLEEMVRDAQWREWPGELSGLFSQPDLHSAVAGWCWTTPWLVIPLVAIGFWRMLARGFRQRKLGITPPAWITLLAAIMFGLVLLPTSSAVEHRFGLIWLGIAFSAFAVADMLYLLYEQLALPLPPTGPSNVPHV